MHKLNQRLKRKNITTCGDDKCMKYLYKVYNDKKN